MILKDVITRRFWQARIQADGLRESEKVTLSENIETRHPDATIAWVKQITFHRAGNTAVLNPSTGALTTSTPPTFQIESFGITAAVGCTSSGILDLIVTGAGIVGSPLPVSVPLTTVEHTTQNLIAQACGNKLATIPAITALYTVGVAANGCTLTAATNSGNDPTLSIAVPGTRGVTATTSSNSVTGVFGSGLINTAAVNALGDPFSPAIVASYFEILVTGGSATVAQAGGFGTVTMTDGMLIRAKSLSSIVFTWVSGTPQIDIVFIGK